MEVEDMDMDVEQQILIDYSDHEDDMEEMELGYGGLQDQEQEEDGLISTVDTLCTKHQVSKAFQEELYTVLFGRPNMYKPVMDIAVASAVAEMKNQLSFQLTKHFVVLKKAAGNVRAMNAMKILKVQQYGALLQYHSVALACKSFVKQQPQMLLDLVWKDPSHLVDVEEPLRDGMTQLLWYNDGCKEEDEEWAKNIGDRLLDIAETAVFKDRALELKELMRKEATDYSDMRFYRDKFAHVFECSKDMQRAEEDVFVENSKPPAKKMSEAGYMLYKKMMHVVEGVREEQRYTRKVLYEYCIQHVRELHAPLVNEFEKNKRRLAY